jgi:hypothetical protein
MLIKLNCIGGVMVSVLASSTVDRGFEPRSGQTKDFKMGICCFSAKHANSAIFQLHHGKNQLIFNEIMIRSALYSTNSLSWIFIVLAHWNNSLWIDMSPYSDTLSWSRTNKSLLFQRWIPVNNWKNRSCTLIYLKTKRNEKNIIQ